MCRECGEYPMADCPVLTSFYGLDSEPDPDDFYRDDYEEED